MRRALTLAFALATCWSCTSHVAPSSHHQSSSSVERLVAKADLAPCPTSGRHTSQLPTISLPCLGNGPTVTLNHLTGPALVNVWASWCEPCQRESPDLQRIYRGTQGRLTVIGIDFGDARDSALDFATHVGMHYPSVFDRNEKVQAALHVVGLPITLFVDGSGHIVGREIGQYHGLARLRADIARYLGVRV